MTYKLKEHLFEDAEYVGSISRTKKKPGIILFAIPELFVPIKKGNIGTHNAILSTNLTLQGKEPKNVHTGLEYIPFIVFEDDQELKILQKAIKNHNPNSDKENYVLKGLDKVLSKQKNRKGSNETSEEDNEEETVSSNDITDNIIPVSFIDTKKASIKLAKIFNKISGKNLPKIEKIIKAFQDASKEEKEKYADEIYDLGLDKKNLLDLSRLKMPFKTNDEEGKKTVSLNTINTTGEELSSDGLSVKTFGQFKDLQMYFFILEAKEGKEKEEKVQKEEIEESRDLFLKNYSLVENFDYLDKKLLEFFGSSATKTSFVDVAATEIEDTRKELKATGYKILKRSGVNTKIYKLSKTGKSIKKLRGLLIQKLFSLKNYVEDDDIYEDLLSSDLYEKHKIKEENKFSGTAKLLSKTALVRNFTKLGKKELIEIEDDLNNWFENKKGLYDSVIEYYYSVFDIYEKNINTDFIYSDEYMIAYDKNFAFCGELNSNYIKVDDALNFTPAGQNKEELEVVLKIKLSKFLEEFGHLIAYELLMKKLNILKLIKILPKKRLKFMMKLPPNKTLVNVAKGDVSITTYLFADNKTLPYFGNLKVENYKKQALATFLKPYFDEEKEYINVNSLNKELRQELAIAYKTIQFYYKGKNKEDDPTKKAYDSSFFDSKTKTYALIGGLIGLNQLSVNGIFDYFFADDGSNFFATREIDQMSNIGNLALNSMWIYLGVPAGGALIANLVAKPLINKVKKEIVSSKSGGFFNKEMKDFSRSILEIACNIKGLDSSISKSLHEGRDSRGQFLDIDKVFKKNKVLWHKKRFTTLKKEKVIEYKKQAGKVLATTKYSEGLFKELFDIEVSYNPGKSKDKKLEEDRIESNLENQLKKMFNKSKLENSSYQHKAGDNNVGQKFFAYLNNLQKKYKKDYVGNLTNLCKKDNDLKNKITKVVSGSKDSKGNLLYPDNVSKIIKINELIKTDYPSVNFFDQICSIDVSDRQALNVAATAEESYKEVFNLEIAEVFIKKINKITDKFLTSNSSKEMFLKKIKFIPTVKGKDEILQNTLDDISSNKYNSGSLKFVYDILEDVNDIKKETSRAIVEVKKEISKLKKNKIINRDFFNGKEYYIVSDDSIFRRRAANKKTKRKNRFMTEEDSFSYFLFIKDLIFGEIYGLGSDKSHYYIYILICIARSLGDNQIDEILRFVNYQLATEFVDDFNKAHFDDFLKVFSSGLNVHENFIFKDGIKNLIEG